MSYIVLIITTYILLSEEHVAVYMNVVFTVYFVFTIYVAEQRPLPPPLLDQQGDGLPTSLSQPMLPLSNEIFGIIVHRTDILRASVNISHPCIRVSVVDISDEASGAYARKSNPTKCVTSYYETGNPVVDYILPVLTQPFESSDRR